VERVLERANATEEVVASGMCGDLSKVPLTSLLSLVEMERRAGVLHLSGEEGSATLHLVNGAVVRIDLGESHESLQGIERFFHVLEWQTGRFEFSVTSVAVPDEMHLTTSHVLLEHARQHDERLR
jgi:hypothetical protein